MKCSSCSADAVHGSYCADHYYRNAGNQAKTRSQGRGGSSIKPCDLSYSNGHKILPQLVPEDMKCPVCEKDMERGEGHCNKNNISLDCIEPSKGYVVGNMWYICWECNLYKGEESPDTIIGKAIRLKDAVDKHIERTNHGS